MKSSDAKASKCHLKFSSRIIIFIKLLYLISVISLKWQFIGNLHCHLSENTLLKYTSLIKINILEENFKWHLEAFVFWTLHIQPVVNATNYWLFVKLFILLIKQCKIIYLISYYMSVLYFTTFPTFYALLVCMSPCELITEKHNILLHSCSMTMKSIHSIQFYSILCI